MSNVVSEHRLSQVDLSASAGSAVSSDRPPSVRSCKATSAKGRRIVWWLLPCCLPLTVLVLWQLATMLAWVPAQILPPPLHVWQYLEQLWRVGELWTALSASLLRVFVGFLLGALIGVVVGTAMGVSAHIKALLLPTFNALMQIPVIGWLPLAMLCFGIGETLKYVLVARAALVPITYATLQAFDEAPDGLLEVGRIFGFKRTESITRIVLPAAIPTLFTGFRLGFTHAWLALVLVELIASSEGLGFLLVYGRQLFQMDLVLASVVVLGIVGWLIDRLLDIAEAHVNRRQGNLSGVHK